ncbi:hypothetical protein ABMC88_12160 [Sulfitobacter sp. HNIBRBA2951]|uniref:hypothetical protein n=1 Tax=Sulfitobacter aquimarinus TaxID=3158557 RepID=UPI0032DF0A7E
MAIEASVALFTGAALVVAYTILYPRLPRKTVMALFAADIAAYAVILATVGAVFYGTRTLFWLFFFDVPWWLFTFVIASLIEVPLFMWFCARYDIDLNPPED